MKIKNLRVFATSALIFAVIGTLNACRDSKLNNQSNAVKTIQESIEDIKFEDVFVPVENTDINIKPTISSKKTR